MRIVMMLLAMCVSFAQDGQSLSGDEKLIVKFDIKMFVEKYCCGYQTVNVNKLWYAGYLYTLMKDDKAMLVKIGLYPSIELTETTVQQYIEGQSGYFFDGPYGDYNIGDRMWYQIYTPVGGDPVVSQVLFIRSNMLFLVSGDSSALTMSIAQNVDNDVLSRNEDYLSFSSTLNCP